MIMLKPFPIGELRDTILRTAIRAEDVEDVAAIAVFRFYTVEVIEDKRKGKVESVEGE